MDESRKQFEREFAKIKGIPLSMVESTRFKEDYWDEAHLRTSGISMAWEIWKSSRAAIDIALPEIEKWRSIESVRAQIAYRSRVRDEVIAAGIKVKE
ncbi:hypothetical protein DBY68_019375 [Pseudocitrobacter sp. RIT415]|uniref:hypothetical protein n=1 Tax=Pseudocitrobacter sp. RIT415 TaxID=2202163 RepID=UPI000D38DD99|nr:hypothetical protein [Pseudocitrobacter sp. RIT 415]RAU43965.1 hypothetical protein DBY68_019375 [Pseudocitrobacter sp. RIT 415]